MSETISGGRETAMLCGGRVSAVKMSRREVTAGLFGGGVSVVGRSGCKETAWLSGDGVLAVKTRPVARRTSRRMECKRRPTLENMAGAEGLARRRRGERKQVKKQEKKSEGEMKGEGKPPRP